MRRVLVVISATLLAGAGSAHGYSNLFAFGDSLSDGGTAYALAGTGTAMQLPLGWPPSPPAAQRFTNGLTAVEMLALGLGLPALAPGISGGSNYAVGGATTGALNFNAVVGVPPGLPPALLNTGMQSQVTQFLGTMTNPADGLFFLWGGPNDLLLAGALSGNDPMALAAAAQTAVVNLATGATRLAMAGAQHFLVPNMPDLGATPFGQASGNAAGLTALAAGFNAGLSTAMAQVDLIPGVDVVVFDTFAFFAQVRADPAAFGFANVDKACLANLSALAASCAGYLFFDELHPTAAAHTVLGAAFQTALIPEPETWAMLAAGLTVLAIAVRRRRVA